MLSRPNVLGVDIGGPLSDYLVSGLFCRVARVVRSRSPPPLVATPAERPCWLNGGGRHERTHHPHAGSRHRHRGLRRSDPCSRAPDHGRPGVDALVARTVLRTTSRSWSLRHSLRSARIWTVDALRPGRTALLLRRPG